MQKKKTNLIPSPVTVAPDTRLLGIHFPGLQENRCDERAKYSAEGGMFLACNTSIHHTGGAYPGPGETRVLPHTTCSFNYPVRACQAGPSGTMVQQDILCRINLIELWLGLDGEETRVLIYGWWMVLTERKRGRWSYMYLLTVRWLKHNENVMSSVILSGGVIFLFFPLTMQ